MERNRISGSFAISSAQCERTIFGTKYDKMWCPISFEHQHSWDPDQLSGEGSSVEEFDSSDSIDDWFSTDRNMGDYTHCPSDCRDSGDNDDDN